MKTLLKKLLAVSLCAAMVGSAAVTLPVLVPDSGITASAETDSNPKTIEPHIIEPYTPVTPSPTVSGVGTYGVFSYEVNADNTITIKGCNGDAQIADIPSEINDKPVTHISERAFSSCGNLMSVTIPSSVTTIGDWAFSGCSSLTSITIPDSVEYIGNSVFSDCFDLITINVSDNNQNYSSQDGILYNKQCTILICCPCKKDSVSIPESVKVIGDSAFGNCQNLKNVIITKNVTSIGDYAFQWCSSLVSVSIPESVTEIGQYAFIYCALDSVNIPENVSSIEDGTFFGCSCLSNITISNGVNNIGYQAFCGCESLKSVVVPNSLASIGDEAFYICKNLTNITLSDSVTSIGNRAFYGCRSLTNVEMPNSISDIGQMAFSGCKNIKSINIPVGLKKLSVGLFSGCTNLESVTIPNTVTNIEYDCFYHCYNLRNITLPTQLISIDMTAFGYCTSLTSITIPEFVSGIGAHAFSDCNSLKEINVDSNNEYFSSVDGALYDKNKTVLRCCPGGKTSLIIPDGVKTIYQDAIDGSQSLKNITIPSSVTSIEDVSLGYYYDDYWDKQRVSDFIIYGETGSVAETYAKDNDLQFVSSAADTKLKNSSAISATTVTAGTEVTMTGKATGGTSPYKYAYYYKKSTDSTWTKAYVTSSGSVYTKYDSMKFTPKTAGTYTVRINVKDKYGEGTVVSKDFKLTVKDAALTNKSTVSATTVTAGTEVTLTGKATGGTSPYKYAYYYKKSTDSAWTKAYVTSSGSAYTKYDSMKFTPETSGTYDVRINVKDKYGEGTVVSKDFKLTVTADTSALTNNSTVSAASVTAGTEVTLTGKATGGTSPYKYAYYYKKSTDSMWTKAYVTSSGSVYTKYDSMKFTPKTAGTYIVRINVKDKYGEGTTVTKDFKLTVK